MPWSKDLLLSAIASAAVSGSVFNVSEEFDLYKLTT